MSQSKNNHGWAEFAALALDGAGPLLLVAAQMAWFIQPLLAGWIPAGRLAEWGHILEDPQGVDRLSSLLEGEMAEGKADELQ